MGEACDLTEDEGHDCLTCALDRHRAAMLLFEAMLRERDEARAEQRCINCGCTACERPL